MNIIVSNYGITVGSDFISFEGKTHEGFLMIFLAITGMSLEYLKQYKQDREVTGKDEFTEKVLDVVTKVHTLKANQLPLTHYSRLVASNYYQENVVNGARVVPGSVVEMPVRKRK